MVTEIIKQIVGPAPTRMLPGSIGNILMLSMRGIICLAANCLQYELEDIFTDAAGADRVEPQRLELVHFERRVYKVLRAMTSSPSLGTELTPKLGGLKLEKTYDLFLPVFNDPYEVYALSAIRNWKECCKYSACLITEAWEANLPKYLLETLSEFDHIFVSANPVDSIARITGRPCTYLPLGIDAIGFCPFPNPPARGIDVLGIGRRSPVTHAALLSLAREKGLFYYFDTIRMNSGKPSFDRQITFSVMNAVEHRFKLASMLKRSRFFMASRARANEADLSQQDEMSGRFFEGAAAGAIMIGEPPRSDKFRELFDWPDAVVRAPFEDPNVGDVIAELEADPVRSSVIRKNNIVNALRRHDNVYRLRTILEVAGLPMPPGLLAREARLRELADLVESSQVAP